MAGTIQVWQTLYLSTYRRSFWPLFQTARWLGHLSQSLPLFGVRGNYQPALRHRTLSLSLFPFLRYPWRSSGCSHTTSARLCFGASWEAVGDVLGAFSLFVVGLLLVIVLLIRLIRYMGSVQRVKTGHQLAEVQNVTDVAPIIDPPAPSSGHLPLS